MKSVDIEYEQVNIPLTPESINKLGEENGISMYIMRTYRKDKIVERYEKKDGVLTPIYIDCEVDSLRTMKIDKIKSGYIAIIDGNFSYEYSDEIITDICKLNLP